MIIEDEREFESFEEHLYFLEEAERLEFLREQDNIQLAQPENEETVLAAALESARINLGNVMNADDHRVLNENLIEYVWDFYHK